MVENLLDEFGSVLAERIETSKPFVTSTTDGGETYRLYRTFEVDANSLARPGLYAVTRTKPGEEERVFGYGKPRNADFETPMYAYLDRVPERFDSDVRDHISLIKSVEQNNMRRAFEDAFNGTREMQAVNQKKAYIAPDKDEDTTLANLAKLNAQSFNENSMSEEEYEAVDWDALTDATQEALLDWRRGKANGVVADDWRGVTVLLDYEDWRPTARDLALHTKLSDGQAIAYAVAGLGFNISETAEILNKDPSVISRQLNAAADKLVAFEKTVEKMKDVSSRTLSDLYRKAEQREMNRVAEAEYERDKGPKVGFYTCPNCGLDTGAWTGGYLDEGEFEADDPPEFIVGPVNHPQYGTREGRPVKVECPECGHSAQEHRFESAWRERHGRKPEPSNVPEGPEPY